MECHQGKQDKGGDEQEGLLPHTGNGTNSRFNWNISGSCCKAPARTATRRWSLRMWEVKSVQIFFTFAVYVHHALWLVKIPIICYFERNHFQWWCGPSSMLWRGRGAFFSELWRHVNTVERSRKTVNIVSCLKTYIWLFYRCSTTEPFSFWDMKYWFCCILNQTFFVLSNLRYIWHKKN